MSDRKVRKVRTPDAAAAGSASEGRRGVGCLERGSCLLASSPGVGAPLLELYASAARPRDKASRRPSGKNSRRGVRAAGLGGVGGSVRLAATSGGEHVCALGGAASCLAARVPVGLESGGGSSAQVVLDGVLLGCDVGLLDGALCMTARCSAATWACSTARCSPALFREKKSAMSERKGRSLISIDKHR